MFNNTFSQGFKFLLLNATLQSNLLYSVSKDLTTLYASQFKCVWLLYALLFILLLFLFPVMTFPVSHPLNSTKCTTDKICHIFTVA